MPIVQTSRLFGLTFLLFTNWNWCLSLSLSPISTGSQHDQGPVCGGICCDAETELQLQAKATKTFERLVKHHIRSQRGLWESAANVYKGKCGCVGRCQQCGWRIRSSVNFTVGCFFMRLTRIKSVGCVLLVEVAIFIS